MMDLSVRKLLALCAAVAPLIVGCAGSGKKDKIWVYRYPDFYRPELKRIAVLPFGNRTRVGGVGGRISDKVSAILTNNRTYEVYTRAHLSGIEKELKLAESGIIDPDAAKRIGRLKSVQALICGVCNRCESVTRKETRYNRVPVWGRNPQGQRVITGWRKVPYRWARHDAFVECNVVVIDCGTGRQIAAVHRPSNLWASGSPPKYAPADLLRQAEEDQIKRIVQAIAVTRTQIKLKGDVLKTATGFYEQKFDWQRRLTPGDGTFLVVVQLPPTADRNNFQITVVPKGEREIVAQQRFVWTKRYGRYGYEFKIQPLLDKNGFGEYQAKLYSGPAGIAEPIAHYDFSIVEQR
jgi:hypothetical protein